MEETEFKFVDFFESSPDAALIVDQTGKITLANSQIEELFGFSRSELIGELVEKLIPDRFKALHAHQRVNFFEDSRKRPMGTGLGLSGLRKDKTEFPVDISLSPMKTPNGVMVYATIRDMTEWKEVEKSLKEVNRLKSEFLANMSHELRTPLNSVIGFSEFLIDEKSGALNQKQKEYLSDILNSGKHLLQLINDILDLSKVEAGRVELSIEQFSVRQIVAEVCSSMTPDFEKKKINLKIDMFPKSDLVSTDKQKMKQVLFNLLSNALKFTDEKGSVEVSCCITDKDELQIQIKDTGIGINSEDLDKLFMEFKQLNSGADRRFQGTGLGLALTKKLVVLLKGTISVESLPGKGSVFTVIFPRLSQ